MKEGRYKLINFGDVEIEITDKEFLVLKPNYNYKYSRGYGVDTLIRGILENANLEIISQGDDLTLKEDPVELTNYPKINRLSIDEDGLYYCPAFKMIILNNSSKRDFYFISEHNWVAQCSNIFESLAISLGVYKLEGTQEIKLSKKLAKDFYIANDEDFLNLIKYRNTLIEYQNYFESTQDRIDFIVEADEYNVPWNKVKFPKKNECNFEDAFVDDSISEFKDFGDITWDLILGKPLIRINNKYCDLYDSFKEVEPSGYYICSAFKYPRNIFTRYKLEEIPEEIKVRLLKDLIY